MKLQSETVWLGTVQIISSHLSFPQVDSNQHNKNIKWCLCVFLYIYIYIFLSIKPQRKWLNWLKGQADVAAHKYNLWEWSDLWVFVCFRVAESLKDGFILQEEVVSAALCSWKRGGACPYSSLPGVRYTLGSLDSQVSWRNWNSHEPHCHGLINRPWHE